MTPQEKARQLIFEFYDVFEHKYPMDMAMLFAKECALICVDEILNTDALLNEQDAECIEDYSDTIRVEYWQQVKTEIEKL